MSTYGAMKTRIADELNRDDLTSQIALAIQSAIDHYKYDRLSFTEGSASSATVSGTEYYALPASPTEVFSVDSIQLTDGSDLITLVEKPFSVLEQWQTRSTPETSRPYYWAEFKEMARLYPVPDAAYTLTWHGVIALTALSADGDTNAWMTKGEELIRQRAKAIINLDIVRRLDAMQEAAAFSMRGERYLSNMERSAHKRLVTLKTNRTTGRLKAGC